MEKQTKQAMMSFRLPAEYKPVIEKIAQDEFYTASQWLWKTVKAELDRLCTKSRAERK